MANGHYKLSYVVLVVFIQKTCPYMMEHIFFIILNLYLKLFVIVMTVGGENDDKNLGIVDFINQTVFLGNSTTPPISSTSLQLLRLTCASSRVFIEFSDEIQGFFIRLWLTTK